MPAKVVKFINLETVIHRYTTIIALLCVVFLSIISADGFAVPPSGHTVKADTTIVDSLLKTLAADSTDSQVAADTTLPKSPIKRTDYQSGNSLNREADTFLDPQNNDMMYPTMPDSAMFGVKSIEVTDSTMTDTVKKERKPFLDDPIFIKFTDSMVYVPQEKDIYLHKQGEVKYQDKQLSSDYMRMNTLSKLVNAQGIEDTATMKMGRVAFIDGSANYDMDSITYNMSSGKALIHGVKTKEGEGFLFGGKVKKMKDNVTHMHGGRYTTCDADCPHFYLQMTKGTVIPGKQTVFGPAYMVFEGVPLYPLTIPFGFFPQKKEQNSGIIIPEIGEEYVKGFFLRNGGYYFAISDYINLRLMASIYTLGSWGVSASSEYRVRYKLSGSFLFEYNDVVIGDPNSSDYTKSTGFKINWQHRQDAKFNPSSTFSASVNITTDNKYNRYNTTSNINNYVEAQTSSSVAYTKNWAGTPMSLSINARYGQNFRDSTVTLELPTLVFNVSSFAPFKRKNPVGKERWYERIMFSYAMNFGNSISNMKDYNLFKEQMWNQLKTGFKHTPSINASFNIGGVFNIGPRFSYTERWYFRKIDQNWNSDKQRIEQDTVRGFYRVYDYSASIDMGTKIYGTYTIGTKKPAIFRHIMTPELSFSYAPNFGDPQYGFWKKVQSGSDGRTTTYSPYANELYGTASNGQQMALTFSLRNTLEAKIPSDKDTSGFRKIKIIDGFDINSSYNFLADSLNLEPFRVSLRIPLFKSYVLNVAAVLDPYQINQAGQKINRFMVQDGGFLRLTSLTFSFNYTFKSKASPENASQQRGGQPAVNDPTNNNNSNNLQNQFFDKQIAEDEQLSEVARARIAVGEYYDFKIPWSVSIGYNFNYSNYAGKPSIIQTFTANGNVSLTDKWALSLSGGFDIQSGRISHGQVQVTRDLHCWQMSFSWVPIGYQQSWSFTIQAKSSMLSDLLKWKKDQSFYDNHYFNN